jgi:FlaA1/EpsC-like NDP-sugar epimerase
LSKSICDKHVLVTGAGGSIGSELATQALKNGVQVLVILDSNELALYTIEQSLLNLCKSQLNRRVEIIPVLGSVLDQKLLASLLQRFGIHTVYHAAAYKHVPLVEQNIINGVRNNVFGTKTVVDASIEAGVERFILVSTDKAVRPTNIMGATKRLAELIVQGASEHQSKTIVSMVRFGNVLGSSGSVVPHFKKQIADGGPVTLTHPEINRYFMTIPEAASLVIQAGSMSEGGEVFVLDMGEPVKIIDLAKNMIKLSGYSVQDSDNTEGDIAIEITGLRPGEKLYEELLICGNEEATNHPKIMKANEAYLNHDELEASLGNLSAAIDVYDSKRAKEILISTVKEYQASDRNVDWLI